MTNSPSAAWPPTDPPRFDDVWEVSATGYRPRRDRSELVDEIRWTNGTRDLLDEHGVNALLTHPEIGFHFAMTEADGSLVYERNGLPLKTLDRIRAIRYAPRGLFRGDQIRGAYEKWRRLPDLSEFDVDPD